MYVAARAENEFITAERIATKIESKSTTKNPEPTEKVTRLYWEFLKIKPIIEARGK